MPDDSRDADRLNFLKLAVPFQGALLGIALVLSWCLGYPVWQQLTFSAQSVALGVVATLPMLVFLVLLYQTRIQSLVQIRQLLSEYLGKSLASCSFVDLCALALLAGVSEEFLFRGVIEPWLSRWGSWTVAIVVGNILFGICHAVTPMYAVLAGLIGIYLSSTLWWAGEPNLLIPALCHALYDLVAFVVVRNSYLRAFTPISLDADSHSPANNIPDNPVLPVDQ